MRPQRWIAAALVGVVAALAFASPAAADPVRDAQWQLDFLRVAEAHTHSQGEDVIVGVVDSGVDGGHPDLAGSVLPGKDYTNDGSDGRIDVDGHGTAMAGLIAAHGRALGIAPGARILPVRAAASLTTVGSVGVDWAIDNGAKVLCLAYVEAESALSRRIIERAVANDIVVVAAIGNAPLDAGTTYPAAYPGVVGAAGVDRNGNHAQISLVSAFSVLSAPAVETGSTDIRTAGRTGYGVGTGTSGAAAIIAGAAALVRAKYPHLSATEVIHRLTATADDKGAPGRDDEYGYGVVNLVKALTADVPAVKPTATPAATDVAPPGDGAGMSTTAIVIGALALVAIICAGLVTVVVRARARPQ